MSPKDTKCKLIVTADSGPHVKLGLPELVASKRIKTAEATEAGMALTQVGTCSSSFGQRTRSVTNMASTDAEMYINQTNKSLYGVISLTARPCHVLCPVNTSSRVNACLLFNILSSRVPYFNMPALCNSRNRHNMGKGNCTRLCLSSLSLTR